MKIKQPCPSQSILEMIYQIQDANGALNKPSSWLRLVNQHALSVRAVPQANAILA